MMATTERPLAAWPGGDDGCARYLDVRSLALGGEVAGRDKYGPYVMAPGPGHRRHDRSLKITVYPDAPDGFWVHSFANDNPIACRDHVRAAAGLPAWSPRSGAASALTRSVAPCPVLPDEDEERRDAWLRDRVRAIWEEAQDPRGTLVETFLREERSLCLPDDVAGSVLRFHPACPWNENGQTIRVPAMITAMRAIQGDELVAVHRTRLSPDGQKVDRRMLGPAAGAAVKLDPDEAVTMGLIIGEGIETCLAARQLGFQPVWATGSAGGIRAFPVLPGIEALTVLAEVDANGANERAVNECGARWHEAGRDVIVADPRSGKDINDALRAGGSE